MIYFLIIWAISAGVSLFAFDIDFDYKYIPNDKPVKKIIDNIKNIGKIIYILPMIIIIPIFVYLLCMFCLIFNFWLDAASDMIDSIYPVLLPFYKKKWINFYLNKNQKSVDTYELIKYSNKELQRIIIQDYIKKNMWFNQTTFIALKDGNDKWEYLNLKSTKRGLNDWEKLWLKEFIALERDRKIDEIFN